MKWFAMLGLGLITLGWLLHAAGLRVNTSSSIPKGLYQISHEPIGKGKFILFCPKNSTFFQDAIKRGYLSIGFCPGRISPMMKQVTALPGDVVTTKPYGVIVNSLLLSQSRPQLTDAHGRFLTHWQVTNYKLKPQELLVMADQNPWSFDGRYFGLIQTQQIKAVIKPLWTWA